MDHNNSWLWMVFMALILGIRHGLDLDHLATIDAMTRTVRESPYLSKMVGFLFSLGHGLVVTLISLLIGGGLMETKVPEWLDGFGSWISFFFLVIFGLINLWNITQTSSHTTLPVGIKSFLAKKMVNKRYNTLFIMLIGALFAFSFDTFSQIALFSISASLMSGWMFSGILGLTFTLGMIITDSFNGLFVSMIIQRADGMSLVISQGLGVIISLFSLVTAFFVLMNMF